MANFNVWTEKTAAGNFRVRHRNTDGTQKTDHCVRKDERLFLDGKWLTAKAICDRFEGEVWQKYRLKQLGEYDLAGTLGPLFDEFLLECQSNNLARATIASYTYAFRRMTEAKFLTLADLTKDRLRDWKIALMKDNYSAGSIKEYLVVAMTFMRWLVENEKIGPFAFKKLLPKTKDADPKFYTAEEFSRLDQAALKRNREIHLLVNMAHGAGLRLVEMVGDGYGRQGVFYSDIVWKEDDEADLVLRKEIVKGQRRSRTVPLDAGIVALLGSRREGPIFTKSRFALQEDFRNVRKDAALTDIHTIHGLRHTFAKNYLQAGGSLRGLMDLLGHVSIQTTQIYSHLEQTFKAEAIKMAYKKRLEKEALLNAGNIALGIRGANEGQL